MTKTLPYFGGKMRMAPRIIELLGDSHRHYVEPFAGSAAVLMRKPPVHMESINDLDRAVFTFWKVLRERPDELVERLRLTPYSKAEYYASVLDTADIDDLELARRFVVRSCQSFSGALTGGYGPVSPRKGVSRVAVWARIVDSRIVAMAERIRNVELECMDAIPYLERWDDPRTAAYVDPPYLAETRRSNGTYRHEANDEDYHRRLLETLNRFSGRIVLSGYDSDLYHELLGSGWELHRVDVDVPSGTRRGRSGRRTECLWVKPARS